MVSLGAEKTVVCSKIRCVYFCVDSSAAFVQSIVSLSRSFFIPLIAIYPSSHLLYLFHFRFVHSRRSVIFMRIHQFLRHFANGRSYRIHSQITVHISVKATQIRIASRKFLLSAKRVIHQIVQFSLEFCIGIFNEHPNFQQRKNHRIHERSRQP